MVIPVPEAESNVNYYNRLYKGEFKQPKQPNNKKTSTTSWGAASVHNTVFLKAFENVLESNISLY